MALPLCSGLPLRLSLSLVTVGKGFSFPCRHFLLRQRRARDPGCTPAESLAVPSPPVLVPSGAARSAARDLAIRVRPTECADVNTLGG